MKKKENEFLVNRIEWRAGRFKTYNSILFKEMKDNKLKQEISEHFLKRDGGVPVLVNVLKRKKWTCLGTNKVIWKSRFGSDNSKIEEVLIDQIEITQPKSLKVNRILDFKITTLELHLKDNTIKTFRCRARDLFQFTSIFLMLTRLMKE